MNIFEETKNALLRYYSDVQTALGARLIGFTVALFTLLQVVQPSLFNKASMLLPIPPVINIGNFAISWKPCVLFLGVLVLMVFIIRTIFHYAIYGKLLSQLIVISPFDIPENQSAHDLILAKIGERTRNWQTIKIYLVFPFNCFYPIGAKCGWIVSVTLAFVSTWLLLGLMW